MGSLRGSHSRGGPHDLVPYRNDLDLDAVIDVYRDSTLGERRPVDDRDVMGRMLAGANLVVSAWDGDRMVGIARSLSDFAFCTYLADLAVRVAYQRRGIGRELVRQTQKEGKSATSSSSPPRSRALLPAHWILSRERMDADAHAARALRRRRLIRSAQRG